VSSGNLIFIHIRELLKYVYSNMGGRRAKIDGKHYIRIDHVDVSMYRYICYNVSLSYPLSILHTRNFRLPCHHDYCFFADILRNRS